ncbi:hypothetical protein FQZ97_1112760 [compost metagenome]
MATHGVAEDVHAVQAELVHESLEDLGVEVRARAFADDRVAFAPARAVQQDHSVAGTHQRIDVAVEVGPAAGARTGAVQHDHDFGAVAAVVVVDVQFPVAQRDAGELAGGGFAESAHVGLRVQEFRGAAAMAPKPAIHSGIGR